MLPKTILMPLPPKNIQDPAVRQWIEDFMKFFQNVYNDLYNENFETHKVSVRGNDSKQIHGFFTHKSEIKI